MTNNRYVAPVMAGVLALSIGLAGCGGSTSASTEGADTTQGASVAEPPQPTEPAVSETPEVMEVTYWQGTLSTGETLVWKDDDIAKTASILILTQQGEETNATLFEGPVTESTDGTEITVTDATGQTLGFKILSNTEAGIEIDAGEHGTGTLTPITEEQFRASLEAIPAAPVEETDFVPEDTGEEEAEYVEYYEEEAPVEEEYVEAEEY